MENHVIDLRSALALLEGVPGQLVQTNVPVNAHAELAGVYRYVGAGGTVMRPTQEGPAMIFNSIEDMPGSRVAIGVLASRKRVALLLNEKPERLGFLLNEALETAVSPIVISNKDAVCQQVVHYANEPDFDIRKLLPAPTNTAEDAGPYITLGMCYASDPETGESDVTIRAYSRNHLQRVETAVCKPTVGLLLDVAEVLGVPVERLMEIRR